MKCQERRELIVGPSAITKNVQHCRRLVLVGDKVIPKRSLNQTTVERVSSVTRRKATDGNYVWNTRNEGGWSTGCEPALYTLKNVRLADVEASSKRTVKTIQVLLDQDAIYRVPRRPKDLSHQRVGINPGPYAQVIALIAGGALLRKVHIVKLPPLLSVKHQVEVGVWRDGAVRRSRHSLCRGPILQPNTTRRALI